MSTQEHPILPATPSNNMPIQKRHAEMDQVQLLIQFSVRLSGAHCYVLCTASEALALVTLQEPTEVYRCPVGIAAMAAADLSIATEHVG